MPRVTDGNLVEHRRQVLNRVFASFQQLVAERGYDALTLADITKAAGMTRTTMYNYFPDKEALLLAYTAHAIDESFSNLRAELHGIDEPLERLAGFVRTVVTYAATHHMAPDPVLKSVLSGPGYLEMRRHSSVLEDTLASVLSEAAADGLIPEAVAADPVTIRLVLVCLAAGQPQDLSSTQLAALITSTQSFVFRAVGVRAG
jgi:AcrR family transcriptional regulator